MIVKIEYTILVSYLSLPIHFGNYIRETSVEAKKFRETFV